MRENTRLPERMMPFRSVVEMKSSSISNERSRSTGVGRVRLVISWSPSCSGHDRPRNDLIGRYSSVFRGGSPSGADPPEHLHGQEGELERLLRVESRIAGRFVAGPELAVGDHLRA